VIVGVLSLVVVLPPVVVVVCTLACAATSA
jgi:hypothetical protein